jgi:hypothetical protein
LRTQKVSTRTQSLVAVMWIPSHVTMGNKRADQMTGDTQAQDDTPRRSHLLSSLKEKITLKEKTISSR